MPDRYKTIERHFRLETELYGEEIALKQMRKHLGWYLHGLPHAAKMRNQVFRLQNYEEVRQFLNKSLNPREN
jgi:tRNA-dihydrouridine synthase